MADLPDDSVSLYDLLSVARDASQDDIKRAYRRYSTVLHPDKQSDDVLKEEASAYFMQIKEAYEVLSDPDQRKIYDVYGREGLRAGLEVGDKYKGLEELRKQWKAFQAQSQQVRVATEVAPATLIEITSNASSLVSSINFEGGTHFIPILGVYYEPIWPVVTSTAFHHTLSFKVSDETSITVGGNVHMQRTTLQGRMLGRAQPSVQIVHQASPRDIFQVDGAWGRDGPTLDVHTSRRFSYRDTGTATLSLGSAGLGVGVVGARQLFEHTRATFGWTLGPADERGMALSIGQARERFKVSAKVQIGSITAISADASWKARESTTLRSRATYGETGIWAEVGLRHRFSDLSSAGLTVRHGVLGTIVTTRVKRGSTVIEAPVLLSRDFRDWHTALLAVLGPAIANLIVSKVVIAPIVRLIQARRAARLRQERVAELQAAAHKAIAQQRMMRPLIRRSAADERSRGGLVVLKAMYGDLRSWKRELAADVAASATAPPFDTAEQNPSPSHAATNGAHPPGNSARGEPDGAAAASDGAAPDRQRSGASSSGHASSSHGAYAPVDTAAAAAAAAEAGCLDVTLALQFQVQDSEARLSAAACKGSLLGFADLAPEGRKHLYVAYRHGETLYETEDSEQQLHLPSRAAKVLQDDKAAYFRALDAQR